jgi:hypothetical protein
VPVITDLSFFIAAVEEVTSITGDAVLGIIPPYFWAPDMSGLWLNAVVLGVLNDLAKVRISQ